MLRVVVCVSGGGTNLQAIIDAVADGTITNTELVGVISNNYGVRALERAEKAGIDAKVVSPKDYENRAAFNEGLLTTIRAYKPDLIVLINIHPSLIPSFCGTGYYGLKVHEAALARGVKLTGATVHYVDKGTDTGPILLQKAVEVKPEDTPEILQRRAMEEAEWKLLPAAINMIANGEA